MFWIKYIVYLFTLILTINIFSLVNGLASSWGEPCEFSAECTDHRMECSNTSICVCDRFHEWRGKEIGCFLQYNISSIMNMSIITSTDHKGDMEKAQQIIVFTNFAAGLFVMSVGVICVCSVLGFCFYIRRADGALRNTLKEFQSIIKSRSKTSTPGHSRLP